MEKWEYLTQFIRPNSENEGVLEYLRERWPDWNPPKYTPEAMIPYLNELGEEGWELIHIEPVREVGDDGTIYYSSGGGESEEDWSNVYFCSFKRRIEQGA